MDRCIRAAVIKVSLQSAVAMKELSNVLTFIYWSNHTPKHTYDHERKFEIVGTSSQNELRGTVAGVSL